MSQPVSNADELERLRVEVALVRVENERVRSDIDRIRVEVEQRTAELAKANAERDQARLEIVDALKEMHTTSGLRRELKRRGWAEWYMEVKP